MDVLIWVNTLALLAAAMITFFIVRDIQRIGRETHEILRETSSNLRAASETLSRLERISLATLERVAGNASRS